MKSWVQFITTPTSDTCGTALLLHFDNKRYIIGNLAEGVQRACAQTKISLTKVQTLFLTGRAEWRTTGGLIGMILTLADVVKNQKADSYKQFLSKIKDDGARQGSKKKQQDDTPLNRGFPPLTLFTPPNVNYQLATARRFVFRNARPVNAHEVDELSSAASSTQPYWHDDNIQVWPMSITSGTSSMPLNPRKRSYEMIEDEYKQAIISEDMSEQEHHKLTIKNIVNDMFNSDWKLDTLYETRIADVKMPAKIFIRDEETKKLESYTGPTPGSSTPLPDPNLIVLVRKPWPSAAVESLPPAKPSSTALSYIFRTHTQRGKFLPKNAQALKVPVNKYKDLCAGQAVENSDGEIVNPEQVLEPSRPGSCFAVLDLPDPSYIDGLIARPEWKDGTTAGIGTIIWNCGKSVVDDEKVKTFMASLPDTKHILSTSDHCQDYLTFDSAAAATVRLQQIDQKRYRVPYHEQTRDEDMDLPTNVFVATRGMAVDIEPSVKMRYDSVIKPADLAQVVAEIPEGVLEEVKKAVAAVEDAREDINAWARDIPGKDVEIMTLGTGSALPSKYRNVSSTLMRVPGWGAMLFDCGEGTLGQLRRAFPPAELRTILQELRIISISHMHADHHLGLVNVIREWYNVAHNLQPAPQQSDDVTKPEQLLQDGRLAVIAEVAMQQWLHEYSRVEDFGYSRIAPLTLLVNTSSHTKADHAARLRWHMFQTPRNTPGTPVHASAVPPSALGLEDIQAVAVQHCSGARAVSLTWPDGFKASYSGDCRPCPRFAEIGAGSTVCIHEATFDDELAGDAKVKRHCTTSEALSIAEFMGAKTCILTHFSQRYQKVPILEKDTSAETKPTLKLSEDEDEDEADDTEGMAPVVNAEDAGPTDMNYQPVSHETVKFKVRSDMKVCVAFDFMRVKVGEIAEMQHFTPALVKLFEVDEEDEESAEKGKSRRRN